MQHVIIYIFLMFSEDS